MIETPGPERAAPPAGPDAEARVEAVRRSIAESAGAVRRYLFGICGDWDQAEELAQESMLKAWRARKRFAGRSSVRTWLFAIARNHWRDRLRRKRARPRLDTMDALPDMLDSAAAPPDDGLRRGELAEAVRKALAALPAEQREVLALRESRGLTFAECADVLGLPVSTVKSRARYALMKLAVALGDYRQELDA